MDRVRFLEIAQKHGLKPGKKDNPASSLKAMKKELEDYFDTPEGQFALANAPMCMRYEVGPGGEVVAKEKNRATVIETLLSEFGG
jgi:hypothetical protein